MLIEQTTTYAYKLKYLENPTFDKVKTLAKKFIDELPKELVDDLFNAINRGVDILKTEPEMLVYLYSFGNMHKAKLDFAFDNIPEDFFSQSEINIIDYGCGQAIGTMCYVDCLKSKNYNQRIKSVTLIEPSKKCLRRAALHTSIFLPDADITTVNKTFDELAEEDINCDEDVPTLHILSNVLDLEFNISKFTKFVKGRLKGYNQFVCVGPYFGYDKKDFRMEDFAELVGGDISFSKTFGKGEFVGGKNWTCQSVVASVGVLEENLSTEVTEEDIENGVEEDLYYVVYSKNGRKLLKNNGSFTDYTIHNGTKVICDRAFEDSNYDIQCYTHLCNIVIPESVTTIGNFAFSNCGDLTEIKLPSSLTNICNNPFVGCGPLKIEIESKRFLVVDNMLIDNIEHRLISYFGQNERVIIPNFVTEIGAYAFSFDVPISSDCNIFYSWQPCNLKDIIIPDSVTKIDDYAFRYCRALKRVIIENPTLNISCSVFEGCDALQQIIIPENSFEHFKQVFSITVCDKLKEGYSTYATKYDFKNGIKDEFVVYSEDGKRLLGCWNCEVEVYSIKNGVKVICDKAFGIDVQCNSLRHLFIPNTVITIGNLAFCGCESLKQITIPNSVTIIGDYAFADCKSIQQISISTSVTSIGYRAFYHCQSLKQITIPNSVKTIGDDAFMFCESLQQITISDSVKTIGDDAFVGCKSLQQIMIPDGSEDLFKKMTPQYLWNKLKDKLSIVVTDEDLNNGVVDEFGMVYSSDGYRLLGSKYMICHLPDIYYIKEGTKVICNFAFNNEAFYQNDMTVSEVVVPDSVVRIGDYAFGNCSNLKVEIPQNIETMGKNPFENSNLKSFNSNSSRFVVENDLLIDNQSRQIISYIGKSPCVDIPDTITSIGDYAFSRCTELRLVTIPNSVKSIGEEAFCNCYSLIQITIPKSVVSIGKGAFYDSALQEMTINNPKLIIGDNAFFSGGEPSFQLIIIPEGSEDHFKAMLPEHLWKCLYHLKKVFDIKDRSEEVDDGLPF